LAVENELLALAFKALNILGFEVWFRNGCDLNRCFPSKFGIIAKFSRQQSNSISLYFRGGNPTVLHLKCVIAHQMLVLLSFRRENMAIGMPHFHNKNPAKFHVWCTMAHRQGLSANPHYKVKSTRGQRGPLT